VFIVFLIAHVGKIYVDSSRYSSAKKSTNHFAGREVGVSLQQTRQHYQTSDRKKTRERSRGNLYSASASSGTLKVSRGRQNLTISADTLEPQTAKRESSERVAGRYDELEKRRDASEGELANAALLVIAYNRPDYLRQTLDSLAKVSHLSDVNVYVSQDGFDESVARVAIEGQLRGLGKPQTRGYEHWQRERIPQLGHN
jgi:hypothetical protein